MKKYVILILLFSIMLVHSDNSFRFVVVGDRTGSHVDNIFEEVIDEVRTIDPEFVICVGDLIEGYTDDTLAMHAQWDSIISTVKTLSCPFYFVPGNHDISNESDRDIYEKRTGKKRYYSFNYKKNHFVILDNTMTYFSTPQPVDEEQLEWLRKDLKKNRGASNTFVFYHLPRYLDEYITGEPDPLAEICRGYDVNVVFTGHWHSYVYLNDIEHNTEFITVGSSGGGMDTGDFARGHFYHYLMVNVKDDDCSIAVFRKGNVFPADIVTASDHETIRRADAEVVQMDPCFISDQGKKMKKNLAIMINNIGPDSIIDTLIWTYDPTRYEIEPDRMVLQVGSEEQKEYNFRMVLKNNSDIFPLPRMSFLYPFTYGKACTLSNFLSIKRVKEVKKTSVAPVIDGKLDDKTWEKTQPIIHLATYDGQADPPVEKTEMYISHDDENLYLGVRCFESNFSQVLAQEHDRDGRSPWDDNLWFFFDTNLDKQTYYQMIINSNGAIFDRECSLINAVSTKNIMWDGPWEVATGKESDAWILEIKISKQGLAPYNEEKWGFNFRRLQPRPGLGDAGYWSIPFGHDPESFSLLEFK
jgi:predicted phosphodiesterase